MTDQHICAFSRGVGFTEQLKNFGYTTGAHILTACILNTCALWLSGVEDIYPAIIGGTIQPMSCYIVHWISHIRDGGELADGICHKGGWISLISIITSSSLTSWYVQKYYGYQPTKWGTLKMEGISMISIGLANNFILTGENK